MPLRAAQIFVRTDSLARLAELTGQALHTRRPAPGELRTLIALCEGSWGCVVCDRADRQVAQALSREFGRALAIGVDSSQFALSVVSWENGRAFEEENDPRPPRFRDVEAVAWEMLSFLGVPVSLRLIGVDEVELTGTAGLDAALLRANDEVVDVRPTRVTPPPRSATVPCQPDVVVESKAGEARALEVRHTPPGIPNEAWARALAAVEEAQARRMLRALAGEDGEVVPRPSFTYRSPQALRLEKLLAKARAERPWLARLQADDALTLEGFLRKARAQLTLPVARAFGGHLELASGVRLPVRAAYERYLDTLDLERGLALLAAEAETLSARPPAPLQATGFLPSLLAGEPGARATLPVGEGLHALLLFDDGARVRPVEASELKGKPVESAFERAIVNVDALTRAFPEGVRFFDLEFGRVVSLQFPDVAGAGRILSPSAREMILAVLDATSAFAITPTRDALLACAADEGLAFLREEARRRFEEGPFPITPRLWSVTAEEALPLPDDA